MNKFFGVSNQTDEILMDIADALPHGSGVNCDWTGEVTSQSIRFSNSFQTMDEMGGYDGFADFTVILPLVAGFVCWWEFKIQFNGKGSQYLNQKYGLREYLDETLYYNLEQFFNPDPKCDSCNLLVINGILCHETGCPNTPRKCALCGEVFTGTSGEFCSDQCYYEQYT